MADKLIKKRSSMKAKLTTFSNYLDVLKSCDNLSTLQRLELDSRYSKFDALYAEFDDLQTEIELLSEKPEEAYTVRAQFEEQYYALAALARSLLSGNEKPRDSAGFVTGSEDSMAGGLKNNFIRLPKIDLPYFDGSYQCWLEFRDTFSSLIHDNNSIDNISKFHYLRAALKGTAAEIIKNMDFKSDQYKLAWDLLCERYDNSRLLINNHVQALFNIEPIVKESSSSIRNLIDVTNKNIRALKILNEPTQYWDTLVIYMMSMKLDSATSRHWEEYRNTLLSSPTLPQFCTFLNNKADLLETIEDQNFIKINKTENYKNKTLLITSNNNYLNKNQLNISTIKCPLCSQKHNLYSCESFRNLPIETRIQKAKEFKLCLNCLRSGHFENKCKLSHCKYCRSKHNTLLNLEQPGPSIRNPLPKNENVSLSANIVPTQNTTRSHVLLSTALVQVVSNDGKKYSARVLLDNGSTSNFITESFCTKLGLFRRDASSTTITGGSHNRLIVSMYLKFKRSENETVESAARRSVGAGWWVVVVVTYIICIV
ncbi:unnamed protein product, partial [Brenthis ino]